MFYEAGQFETSYSEYLQAFPLREDKIGMAIWLALRFYAFLRLAWFGVYLYVKRNHDPVAIFTITALGLNILVGYTGQISLGTGAFMGVGAYACYKLTTYFPDVNIIVIILANGFVSTQLSERFSAC